MNIFKQFKLPSPERVNEWMIEHRFTERAFGFMGAAVGYTIGFALGGHARGLLLGDSLRWAGEKLGKRAEEIRRELYNKAKEFA